MTILHKKANPVAVRDCRLLSGFWKTRQELVSAWSLPYQWDVLHDRLEGVERSGVIRNFRIAAGEMEGTFYGRPFQDSDLYKWLEAVSYTLMTAPNHDLEEKSDGVIELIARAQQKDGYLDTLYIIGGNLHKRWTNLRDNHELYCAGHLIEAAIAYHEATGKRKLLDVAINLADHLCEVFGRGKGQCRGYPGHAEIELALVKLYRTTGQRKYLDEASYFIEERGRLPNFFDEEAKSRGDETEPYGPWGGRHTYEYNQSHMPVRSQSKAAGHAVRALYLYCAMADIARETEDDELFQVCDTLWRDVTLRQMYLTGAVGSSQFGEAFTIDYDLPNDTAYNETCASVALSMWARRMFSCKQQSIYIDVLEQALYNTVLSGMSLDGKRYFYVNPLEMWPESCLARSDKSRTAIERQPWFVCSCCPTNVARLLTSLTSYFYTVSENTIFVNLYDNCEADFLLGDGMLRLIQQTEYPWDGEISIRLSCPKPVKAVLALRIPRWCRQFTVQMNGRPWTDAPLTNGYVELSRDWADGDMIELSLHMPVERIQTTKIRTCAGKSAYMRGPIVYCAEQADNGDYPQNYRVEEGEIRVERHPKLLGGIDQIILPASFPVDEMNEELYTMEVVPREMRELRLIPYYAWNNRGIGEMAVWLE